MDAQPTFTAQQAVKYFLANVSNIDLTELVRNMAVHEPAEFGAFLEAVSGKTPRQLAMHMAKSQPETFMRRATFENRHAEAAKFIINELKRGDNGGGKVPAIKKLRETWGTGLKEAKDIVDTVQHEMTQMMIINSQLGRNSMTLFDDNMHDIYIKIMEFAL